MLNDLFNKELDLEVIWSGISIIAVSYFYSKWSYLYIGGSKILSNFCHKLECGH